MNRPWSGLLNPDVLPEDWQGLLATEFEQVYIARLQAFLTQQAASGKVMFPPSGQVFRAFELTPFEQVKVVILGQDPYHGPGQAHGLSFSVGAGIRLPPSLRNIFRELEQDQGIAPARQGDLSAWAKQGVLLLNSVLTVAQGQAAAHQGQGWETFTDAVIRCLNDRREHIVFMLWGSYAQKKGRIIDRERHCVLQAPHPSPLSAHRGWFGSGPFSKANAYLRGTGQSPVDWPLPE